MTEVQQIVEIVTSAVSTVGFPIVITGILLYMQWHERKAHAEESKAHVAAVDACKAAIENNNNLLVRLLERMGGNG